MQSVVCPATHPFFLRILCLFAAIPSLPSHCAHRMPDRRPGSPSPNCAPRRPLASCGSSAPSGRAVWARPATTLSRPIAPSLASAFIGTICGRLSCRPRVFLVRGFRGFARIGKARPSSGYPRNQRLMPTQAPRSSSQVLWLPAPKSPTNRPPIPMSPPAPLKLQRLVTPFRIRMETCGRAALGFMT